MFLKILFLILGVALIVIGGVMADTQIAEKNIVYKAIVGLEIFIIGFVIAFVSFCAIYYNLPLFS